MRDGSLHWINRDLTGQIFGALTVVRPTKSDGKKMRWLCRCQCGNEIERVGTELKKLRYPNCGCLTKKLQSRPKSHGMSQHPAYAVWRSMLDRCRLPTHQAYHNYGGRGIKVCKRWANSFEKFWEDMSPSYQPRLTLERRNNNRGYSPTNCYWTNYATQARNRRDSLPVDIRKAHELTGISRSTLYYRWYNGLSMTSSTPDPDSGSWSPVKTVPL